MNRLLSILIFFFICHHFAQSQVQVKLGGGYGILANHQDITGPPIDLSLMAQRPISKSFHAGLGLRYLGNVWAEGYLEVMTIVEVDTDLLLEVADRGTRDGVEIVSFIGFDLWRIGLSAGIGRIFSIPTSDLRLSIFNFDSENNGPVRQHVDVEYNTSSYWNTTARLEFRLLNSTKYNIGPYVQLVRPLGEKFVQHTTDTPIVLDPAFDEFPFFEENISNIGRISKGGLKTFVGVLLSYNL